MKKYIWITKFFDILKITYLIGLLYDNNWCQNKRNLHWICLWDYLSCSALSRMCFKYVPSIGIQICKRMHGDIVGSVEISFHMAKQYWLKSLQEKLNKCIFPSHLNLSRSKPKICSIYLILKYWCIYSLTPKQLLCLLYYYFKSHVLGFS